MIEKLKGETVGEFLHRTAIEEKEQAIKSLTAELDAAKDEIEQRIAERDSFERMAVGAKKCIDGQQAQISTLKAALEKYADHTSFCRIWDDHDCTCGFEQALKESEVDNG